MINIEELRADIEAGTPGDYDTQAYRYAEASQPTFMGEKPDRGRIVAGHEYPGEGYAILKCGNTEVVIGYSLLSRIELKIDSYSHDFASLCALQRAIHSVTCEASMGHIGSDKQDVIAGNLRKALGETQ